MPRMALPSPPPSNNFGINKHFSGQVKVDRVNKKQLNLLKGEGRRDSV